MADFAALREQMVKRHMEARGIRDPRILDAFRTVPREEFITEDYAHLAYEDGPLPIEAGQTISQPYIVALMIQEAGIEAGDRVLEVGAGSGYAAAVMSRIAERVVAIERQPALAEAARKRLLRLGYDNVEVFEGDGSVGWPAAAPFDAIVAAASGSHVPQPLIDQLAPGGRIVMPVGDSGGIQQLVKLTKTAGNSVEQESICGVRFVPLIGAEGWRER